MTGSKRGLTVFGATLVALLLGSAGAVGDLLVSSSLGTLFMIGFIAGCLLAAGRVHNDDLVGVVIMPPLVYAVITIAVGLFHPSSDSSGAGIKNKAIDVGSELVLRAPALIGAMIVVIVITTIRGQRVRAARREQERAATALAGRRRRTR